MTPNDFIDPDLTLMTRRLTLRPFELDDAEAVYRICSDPRIRRYTLLPDDYSIDSARTWLETHEAQRNQGTLILALTLADAQALIGCCSVQYKAAQRLGSLGYWLSADLWGQGYMTEAVRALVDHSFQRTEMHKLSAQHLEDNGASGRVMQKVGMHQEAVLKEHVYRHGLYHDLIYYALLRPEWEATRRASHDARPSALD